MKNPADQPDVSRNAQVPAEKPAPDLGLLLLESVDIDEARIEARVAERLANQESMREAARGRNLHVTRRIAMKPPELVIDLDKQRGGDLLPSLLESLGIDEARIEARVAELTGPDRAAVRRRCAAEEAADARARIQEYTALRAEAVAKGDKKMARTLKAAISLYRHLALMALEELRIEDEISAAGD